MRIDARQLDSHNYTVKWDEFWRVGETAHGGSLAGVLHRVASMHLSTTLASFKQPDVLSFHYEFLRLASHDDLDIKVTDVKTGRSACFMHFHLYQKNVLRIFASAISTDFDADIGPTLATETPIRLSIPPPNLQKLNAGEADENWLPVIWSSDIFPRADICLGLWPRGGQQILGVLDIWQSFVSPQRTDAADLALFGDMFPSVPDTLARNGTLYDAHHSQAIAEAWAKQHPGKPATIVTSTEAAKHNDTWSNTLTYDIEYKRRVPKEGLGWTYTRLETRMFDRGRWDAEATIYDDQLQPLLRVQQVSLCIDSGLRWKERRKAKPTKL